MTTTENAKPRKASPKDIQLADIKHAKQAIADLLNEQSEMKAENEELRKALQWAMATGGIRYSTRTPTNSAYCDTVDEINALLTRTRPALNRVKEGK